MSEQELGLLHRAVERLMEAQEDASDATKRRLERRRAGFERVRRTQAPTSRRRWWTRWISWRGLCRTCAKCLGTAPQSGESDGHDYGR